MTAAEVLNVVVRDLGEDGVTLVTAEVSCLRCGGELRAVATDDPRGSIIRARRVSLSCAAPDCLWHGVLVSELLDLNPPPPVGRAR